MITKVVKGERGGVVGFGYGKIAISVCRTVPYGRSKPTFTRVQCITEKGYIQSEYFLFTILLLSIVIFASLLTGSAVYDASLLQ